MAKRRSLIGKNWDPKHKWGVEGPIYGSMFGRAIHSTHASEAAAKARAKRDGSGFEAVPIKLRDRMAGHQYDFVRANPTGAGKRENSPGKRNNPGKSTWHAKGAAAYKARTRDGEPRYYNEHDAWAAVKNKPRDAKAESEFYAGFRGEKRSNPTVTARNTNFRSPMNAAIGGKVIGFKTDSKGRTTHIKVLVPKGGARRNPGTKTPLYTVVKDGNYLKAVHSTLGLVATGVIDKDGRVKDVAFLNESHRRVNAIRMPAMKALIDWEKGKR
jgi:hypothetical protein